VATWDRDGDGFAAEDATVEELQVSDDQCPRGYVPRAGDCNDNNNRIRPYRQEVGFNGVDDNCNEMVDEPEFRYGDLTLNTTSRVTLSFAVNHADLRTALRNRSLYAKVKHFKLTSSENVTTTLPIQATDEGNGRASLSVTGLSAGTVYALRPYFYGDSAASVNIGPNLGSSKIDTERYYTMTDSNTEKVHKRFQIVMRGLNEYNNSQSGMVGYRGTFPDGTRYGANEGEAWCTEFYVWVTKLWLSGVEGIDKAEEMRDYFRDWDSWYEPAEIPDRAAPGDYLYLDTNQDGKVNHSGMFLAYDSSVSPAQVWTLEGNSKSRVTVDSMASDWTETYPDGDKLGPKIMKLGYIINAMFQ
jgi:hypothetical protein